MRIREIKNEAKERFALNRYHAMLTYGVIFTIVLNISVLTVALCIAANSIAPKFIVLQWLAIVYGLLLFLMLFLLLAPFSFGMTEFYLKAYRYEKVDAFHIFDGFNKYNLERVVILHLIKTGLIICFTILLIVPGIIYALRTSMAVYLLRANPKMKAQHALRASNRIMKGHCWEYFKLNLSFIGWIFFGLVTFGLAFIWVAPYINVSKIVFYKRELQGDKTMYKKNDDGSYVPADKNDYESDEDEEDDEKNVAVKLMKFQLESEIENYDKQLKIISKPRTNSNELNVVKSLKTNDKKQTMNEMVHDVNELINTPDIQLENQKNIITDSFDFELKNTAPKPEIAVDDVPEMELPPILPKESSLRGFMPNAALPETKTSNTDTVNNGTNNASDAKLQNVEITEKDKPTQTSEGTESIHDRLQRLKNERAARRETISSRQNHAKTDNRSNVENPFTRERIDIEIDEENN